MHRLTLSATILLAACGKPDDGTATDDATTAADTGTTATPTTGTASASTTSGEDSTTGGADATGSSSTSTTTTGGPGSSTFGDEETGSTVVSATEGESTSLPPDTTTTGDVDGFVRFLMTHAAGPCPPNADCDGFDELLASKLLRVEKFGDVGNPVTEVEISDDDFAAAVAVFTDPELIALLDGPDPACNPPTDIFESMLVDDGAEHGSATTLCDQPPITAAREMAVMLRDKYAP